MTETLQPTPTKPASTKPVSTKPANWLIDDFHWVINHSWSLRFVFLAFLFSAAEVILPLATNLQGLPFYPLLIGITTGAAFVARLIAQKHEVPDGE